MDERFNVHIAGIEDGRFYVLHITALVFICISFLFAGITIIVSFKRKSNVPFSKWTRCDRFVVYMAVCDTLLHTVHFVDHIHMLVILDHVHPMELCEFYGFVLYEFMSLQNLLVGIIAINAFVLIKFQKSLNYGKHDWKLLSFVVCVPFVACVILVSSKQIGPTGTYCGIVGYNVVTFVSTLPILIVMIMNTILYSLTWKRIKFESKKVSGSLGRAEKRNKRTHRAAKNMSLFVAAYFVQWWAMPFHGIWHLFEETPFIVLELLAIFSNIGGILNGIVFYIIQRSRVHKVDFDRQIKNEKTTASVTNKPRSSTTSDQCSSNDT